MKTDPSRLTATDFYHPLLHVLAQLTEYRPDIPLHMDTVYQGVVDLMSLNPDDYGIQESSGLPWTRRWVQWSFRNHQSKPYYERKFNRGQPGTTTSPGKRQWALTPAGVLKAREIQDQFSKHNWTAVWLEEKLATTNLYDRLHMHLSQKLSISAASMRISDHVQSFLLTAIAGDKLAKDIQAGKPPSPRRLCDYAVRHAYSELRHDGQDGHMRSLFGSSTARDREVDQTGQVVPRNPASFTIPVDTQVVSLLNDSEGTTSAVCGSTSSQGPLLDVVDMSVDTVEEALLKQQVIATAMERLADVLRYRKPGANGRYADEILEAYRLGYSTKDLASEPTKELPLGQGVSHNRAATLWSKMRATLREAIAEGDLEDVREIVFGSHPEVVLESYRLGQGSDEPRDALDDAVSLSDVGESDFPSEYLFS